MAHFADHETLRLLSPATILPAQLPARVGGIPEKRLMLAVLSQAVGTFRAYAGVERGRGRRLFAEVNRWFGSDETGWPFDFVNICQALDLDVGYFRAGLERWRRENAPRRLDPIRLPPRVAQHAALAG